MRSFIHHTVGIIFVLVLLLGYADADVRAASWYWEEKGNFVICLVFLVAIVMVKIAFHKIPKVPEYVPESLALIVVGIIMGVVIRYGIKKGNFDDTVWKLSPELFFDFLLPPIVLQSAYSLYNRTFSEFLGVIVIHAVLSTILNFLIIGFAMYGFYQAGAFGWPSLELDLKVFLLWASIIVAVDPVAVLAIFQDIGVELSLYYIVFGESLLNDAITVVLYEIMSVFTGKPSVQGWEIGVGIASFFTVSFGGLGIGIVVGLLSCLVTRIEFHLSGGFLIIMSYFAYIFADLVGWSGIIAIVGCGLLQAAYAFHNIDHDSVVMVRKIMETIGELTEAVIFWFIGIEVLRQHLVWQTGFMLWGLTICLVSRAVVILAIMAVVNKVDVDQCKTSLEKQCILIYGGLRGGVAYALSLDIEEHKLGRNARHNKQLLVTATLWIILFTIGFMGLTMKPLVKLLKIRLQAKKQLSTFHVLNSTVVDELMYGIEIISGCRQRNRAREVCKKIDEHVLRPILQRDPETYDNKLVKVNERIALKIHDAAMLPDQEGGILQQLPEGLRHRYLISHYTTGSLEEESWMERKSASEIGPIRGTKTGGEPEEDVSIADYLQSGRRVTLAQNRPRQLHFDERMKELIRKRSNAYKQQYLSRYMEDRYQGRGVDVPDQMDEETTDITVETLDEHDEDDLISEFSTRGSYRR
ncbi:unnamed protein product [Calicophoron daubneyi]|uniref:Sodium/hydrogen exchanger n=1 Tax=Calicophoron daubneyi TaxID=300641 RepID=A0AAV2TKM2_CALDB